MRCAIVGSGITGLTAGLLLAQQGHETTIIEALPQPAPLLQGFWREGLYFDTGFHCGGGLHSGGVLRRWLRALDLETSLRSISLNHTDEFRFADGRHFSLPSGHGHVLRAVEQQFPGSEGAMATLLHEMDANLAYSPYLNPELRTEPNFALQEVDSASARFGSAGIPPYLQAILSTRCLLYGVQPHEASWAEYSLVAGPYFQSSGTWEGGGAALAAALLARLHKLGVTIRCGAAVSGIDADKEKGVRGIFLANGCYLGCDQLYFTGHPAQLCSLVPQGLLRPAYRHRLENLQETPSALLLFAEARGDILQSGQSIYLLPSPVSADSFPYLESAAPSVYLFCDKEQKEGRKAVMAVTLMDQAYLPQGNPNPRPQSYFDWKQRAVSRMQAYIETRLPGIAGSWRILEAATPLTLRRWGYGGTGSLYGVRHTTEAMPLLPATRVPGLFLAGQNILLPGILGGIVSAALAVGFAFGHDNALKEFRQCAANE